ncbi:CCAAT/enhancer-binding protein zeta [Condylostylus longicornis]|uniref:CCAAT/enhancer-binding protein zeta n=1 Tax=Condylostylus longicornis TaxID=2530218 RepID=UPI00244DBBFF|nr:CCAAT/enhancer-binding protein zeta [Condylostylus longicornis]
MLSNTESSSKNKKIIFGDDGEVLSEKQIKDKKRKFNKISNNPKDTENDIGKKWYEVYPEYNICEEVIEIKDSEQKSLEELCKNAYEEELPHLLKNNPPDARWLETALHKGTSKDRSNAGALLLTTNPVANIPILETVIGFAKLSNKCSPDVIVILTELFMEALIPSNRKLISFQLRGASWKFLKKQENMNKSIKNKIYAYWHFENRLKELYFEYLKNLQSCLQSGQENNKNSAIISASKLLAYAPEKEQMILSMLVNKLGDPSSKVAAKALHHLTEVGRKHPNMCGVITREAEKLLFRNNISEKAQHFTLCFMEQVLPPGHSDVSTKIVHICFSLFKVLVKKGAVNNKTMQAILRCLQKSIIDAKPIKGEDQILSKEMQDTIYRLVHLADIKISIQTLSLLLEMISLKSEKPDRFYNALYLKLSDLDLIKVGNTTAALFLQIVHKSMHIDRNIPRVKAFTKRLLQISFYLPASFACGCLIVINKVIKIRKDIQWEQIAEDSGTDNKPKDLSRFDGDIDENYKDVENSDEERDKESIKNRSPGEFSSWHHVKVESETNNKSQEISKSCYDAFHRIPAYCGAEFIKNWALIQLQEHYHPSLKLFAQNIIEQKNISYYGDPLRDFGLPYFLERFCFKNPKKHNENEAANEDDISKKYHKHYTPYGGRSLSVKSLTKQNCTEDELFIFNYLEKKRELQDQNAKYYQKTDVGDVDDDEFEEYLDGLVKQTKKNVDNVEDDEDFEVDYMKELGENLTTTEKTKKSKKSKKLDESDDELMDDWGDDEDISDNFDSDNEMENGQDDIGSGSDEYHSDDNDIDIESDDEEGDTDIESDEEAGDTDIESDDEDFQPKKKKTKFDVGFKDFKAALKEKTDMKSLFAAVDDFADILDEAGKTKDHGTSKQILNKDKASDKQLKWEEKRRSNYKGSKNWKKVKSNKNNNNKNFKKKNVYKGKMKKGLKRN